MNNLRSSCPFLALTQLLCEAQVITTVGGVDNQGFAGSGSSTGFAGDGGPATNALLNTRPAVAQAGNLYIADAGNYRVCKVDTSGIITTVAGNGQIDLTGTGNGGAPINAV